MPLVKNAATSLAQGVSQQAESQRYPSQATEQINAYSSPIKGLVKRPPSKFLTKVDLDTTNRNNTFIHTINRDSDEQYVLAIDKQNEYPVTAVSHSNDTITTGTALAANTPVRFLPNDSQTTGEGANGTLPTGLEKGTTYFTKTNNVTTQVSATAGGAAIPIGKVSITDIKLESVKHTDGRWVDGVFAVTFAAGHGFEVGDIIQIDGLTGDAALILNATEQYLLRKPTQVMDEYDTNGTAIARSANQFLLGKPNGDTGSFEDNLGYAVDERWVEDNDDDGWNMYGASVHWVFYKDGGNSGTLSNRISNVSPPSGDNLCNELIYNTSDNDEFGGGGALNGWAAALTDFQAGDLLRLGSRRNTDKSIRAVVASVDGPFTDHAGGTASYRIKLRNYIKLKDLVDSDSSTNYGSTAPPWNYIAYWGDTTSTTPAASNPRQILSTDITNAHIGLNESIGSFSMYTGGIRVYDVNSKQEQTLNIDSGLSYLTNTANPASELSAVTVADYTFLVNKTQKVAAGKKPKYAKNNEAFINVRTADYGKRYTVKVGGEVHKQYATTDAHSYAMIQGVDSDGKERPIAKLSSRAVDSKFNGYLVRVIQNWRWDNKEGHPLKSKGKMSNGVWNSTKKHKDNLPPEKHRINEYVGIEYNKEKNEINIWVNFNWAERTSVTSKRTTLDHVLKAVDASPLGDDFKLEETDSTGNVLADSNNDGVPDNSVSTALFFHQVHVGPLTSKLQLNVTPHKGFLQLEDLYYGPETSFGTVNLKTEWVLSAGYVSPSAGKNIIRGRYTGSGVHAAAGGMDFGHANSTGKYKIENGEFFYKSAKWTGQATQKAVGTERIAAVLACNGKRTPEGENFTDSSAGDGVADTGDHGFKKANGLPLEGQFDDNAKEECLGLTWKPSNSGTYLSKYNGSGGIDGSTANWHVQQDGYVIALKHPDGKEFKISVSDDLGGRGLKLTYFEVDEITDLPDRCRHNHVVKVIGNVREEADDYYLRFKADTEDVNSIQHGRWVESLGYETVPDLDKTTMPIGLIREADNTFTLKELDWNERQAGDDQSNPFPSFVGTTINDIFLFRNRLGFLSGENIIFSEAGEYFNFFRTTVAALLDTAPIDVTASTNKVSKLHSAIPYNERLIIFSDQTQFVLDADPFLSPKTVTLSPANEIDNIVDVKPVVSGNSIYYAFSRTGYSGIGELGVSQEDADQMEVANATSHVPKYIKGNIRKIAATSNEDVICCITDDETSATLYVYKYFNNEQNQKVQSAWFKYNFGTPNSDTNLSDYITDISFIDTTLYILIRRNGVMYIETVTFEDDVKDAKASGTMDYQVCLDHRIDKPSSGVTSSSVTLPSNYKVTSTMKLVDEDGNQFSSSTHGNTNVFTCTVPTSKNFFIGEPYTMEYTFSQPFLKSAKATETGRYQIQRAYLEYANARYFTVDVLHNPNLITSAQTNVTNTFSLSIIEQGLIDGTSELQNGFYAFAIQEKNDRLQLTLKNDSPYPSDFLSIDYEARAFSRGSRWRG
jgi:hypothetical protein